MLLILTLAPDLAAVALKLKLGIADYAFDGSSQATEMLNVLLADVRRLGVHHA